MCAVVAFGWSVSACKAADGLGDPPTSAVHQKSTEPSLEGLKQRSAPDRWNRLKQQWRATFEHRRTADREPLAASQQGSSLSRSPVLSPQPESPYAQPVRDPSQLKKVTEILPFYDYTSQPTDDPCEYICPRPDGLPCKKYPAGSPAPECPDEVALSDEIYPGRDFPESLFVWEASNISYNPLYFEDPALERYGHTYCDLLQPFVSARRFAVQLVGLPYQMAIDPIHKRVYPLGWYRPGDCAPYLHYQIPWNTKAAAVEGGVLTGLFFAFP